MVGSRILSSSIATQFTLLALIAGSLAGCAEGRSEETESGSPSALLVPVDTVQASDSYIIRRDLAGRVEAARQSAVGFELQGLLLTIGVREGDTVEAGQTLAELDKARLDARLAEAKASYNQASSARDFARRTLERSEEAAGFEGISAQELDLARDAASTAAAQANAALARLNSVKVDIAKSALKAPYAAVVIRRYVDEGQIVAPGQPVLELQELAAPEVRIGVSGDLAATLTPGQPRQLTVDGRQVDARVRSILPVRDVVTRTVDVIFELDDNAGVIPGDLARLEIDQTVRENGYWLPVGALAEGSRGLWTAYAVKRVDNGQATGNGGTHTLQPRAVEILYEETDRVFVRGALKPGDSYVTGGLHRLVPGLEVRVRDARMADADGSSRP